MRFIYIIYSAFASDEQRQLCDCEDYLHVIRESPKHYSLSATTESKHRNTSRINHEGSHSFHQLILS